jgi:hypothetical protein
MYLDGVDVSRRVPGVAVPGEVPHTVAVEYIIGVDVPPRWAVPRKWSCNS